MTTCSACGTAATREGQKFCAGCGASLAESHDTSVLPTTPDPVVHHPVAPPSAQHPVDPPLAGQAPSGQPRSGGRSLRRWALVIVAALAIVGIGFVSWRLLVDRGGAASPEEAATLLLESAAGQDGVGALRVLNPGEVEGLDDLYGSLQERLAKSGLASGGDGAVLDAFDMTFENLTTDVDELDENAARVYLTGGRLEVALDSGKLPDRWKSIAERYPDGKTWSFDLDEVFEGFQSGNEERPFLTTIKQGGRWYVSPLATAGEYVIESEQLDDADYAAIDESENEDPTVAEDPEDALRTLLRAISSDDPADALQALPRDEVGVLAAYTDIASDLMDQYGVSVDLDAQGGIETEFDEQGDLGRLTVKELAVDVAGDADGDSGAGTVAINGKCLEADGDEACLTGDVKGFTGLDSWYVMLRKNGDGWQVDPLATAVSYGKTLVESLPEDLVLDGLELPELIEPTETLQAGKPQELTFSSAGLVMASIEVKEGQVVVPTTPDDVYTEAFAPDARIGSGDYEYDSFVAQKSGTYRVLFNASEQEASSFTAEVDVLDPKPAAKGAKLSRAAGQKAGAWTVDFENGYFSGLGEEDYTVLDPKDGEAVYDEELDGPYVVVVRSDGVTLAPSGPSFTDGSRSYSGTVDGSTTVDLRLVAGQPTTITGQSVDDIRLVLGDEIVDDTFDGEEVMYVTPDTSGVVTLEIYNYESLPSDFTLDLS